MKRICLLLSLLLATIFSFGQYANLKISPEQPKPGDKIHFEYNTTGTVLGGITNFEGIAYLQDGMVRAQELNLVRTGDTWSGDIITNDTTKALMIVFRNDEMIDNNKEQGYRWMLMENGEPVKDAYISMVELNNMSGFLAQVKVKPEENVQLYHKEFARNPQLKQKYLPAYAGLLLRADKENAMSNITPTLNELVGKKNKTENDYQVIMNTYTVLKDKENSDKIKAEAIKNFPKGMQAKSDMINAFYTEPDLAKKEVLLNKFLATFPPKTEADKTSVDFLYSAMFSTASSKKDWVMLKKYEAKVTNKETLANVYNEIAWQLVGEGLEGPGEELDKAKDYSFKALTYIQEVKKEMKNKPPYMTRKMYADQFDYSYGNMEDTYGLILWKMNDPENALRYQEDAFKLTKKTNTEIGERYILFKEKVKGGDAVKAELEDLFKSGKSTPKMKEILKRVYLAQNHTEAEYTVYMEDLVKAYREKVRQELLKKMINEAAPQFALKDINGNTVSLQDLKGKVVVVDFWATWCGPCRASFPGMQLAQDKYKDDPNVKFVFVDSWENKKPDEILKGADEFVKKNKYTFHVLLDTDDKVIQSYAVDGIPTKFVIDGNNRIRYKAVGFAGNTDQLVDEMSIMIESIKNGTNSDKKGF